MSTATATLAPADSKVEAFCSAQGPEIFRPVAYPTEVWYPDPLDVEAIHAEARDLFDVLLSRATNSGEPGKAGRILLLRGEAGSGKTHLMRAFRTRAHQQGLGYFGYMQMTTSSGNYSRYILHKLIDSLDTPYYSTPANPDPTSGLFRLSTAVAESAVLPENQVRRLREGGLEHDECAALVLDLADEAVRDPMLKGVPTDLIIAMLFLQSEHPAVHNRVLKYLRGEALSDHDRTKLAGISPLDRDEHAQVMIERLGRLMWSVQGASLILCVDQLEDIVVQDAAAERFHRAMKALIKVAENAPSSLIVISCLDDYYDQLRGHLDSPALDRIEKDPSPLKLQGGRKWDEIVDVVQTHLGHLFDHSGLSIDARCRTYPIPEELLRDHVQQTTRSVLTACKTYRERCIREGRLVHPEQSNGATADASVDLNREQALIAFDQSWNDFLAGFEQSPPDDEESLAELLAAAVDLCSDELDAGYRLAADSQQATVRVCMQGERGEEAGAELVIGICNRSSKGGYLGKQIEALVKRAAAETPAATPIVVRSTEYTPTSPKSAIAKSFAKLVTSGGRYVIVPDSDWRAMAAMQDFRAAQQGEPLFGEWLRHAKPLSRLGPLRQILALDDLARAPQKADHRTNGSPTATPNRSPSNGAPRDRDVAKASAQNGRDATFESTLTAPAEIIVGSTRNRTQSEVILTNGDIIKHTAFLGSTGSGKTTAALNVIEQLLIQGVPALLVDRKGDLVTYAREAIWHDRPSDPELVQRQQLLRERLDVAVYTPGHAGGRTIRLPIAPDKLGELKSAERQQTILQVAQSLGQMLGYKSPGKGAQRISVLVKAIEQMALLEIESITLDGLIGYINERDDALIGAIGVLKAKLFDAVLEDLQTLLINRQLLFPTEGEPLSAEHLLGLGAGAQHRRTRLSVISTKFLGETANVQFWVAQLLLELSRWSSKYPSSDLQAVVLFDEADMYLPAIGKPASKQPMEGLLKRARSAGLGVMLATQSPGDLDYKSRENINTWFVGKIKEDTAIKKMKPMLSELRRDIGSELAGQGTGEFFLVRGQEVAGVRSRRSLVETEQVPEEDILRLARCGFADPVLAGV